MSIKKNIASVLLLMCVMSSLVFAVEPTTQASVPIVSAVGPTSMTLSWTNGNGAGRIIVVRQGSDLTQDPADANSYGGTGTFPYGTGNTISPGHFVVYKGVGSSVTVTGMNPSTTYYFKVYEYNGSAGSTDFLLPGLSITQATATPTITITGAVADFGNVPLGGLSSQKTYSVSGTNLNNDDIYITPPTGFQVSRAGGGSFLSENPLVLTQSGGSVNSTTIYVKYSPSSAGVQSGNITHESYSAVTVNQPVSGTGIGEPTTAATFVSSTSTPNSITLTWSGGNGTSKLVVVKSGIAVTGTPSDASTYTANTQFNNGQSTLNAGEYVVYSSTGTSVTVTGLSAGTEYYFKVFDYNGSSGAENYLATPALAAKKTTLASEPTTQASGITFDNVGPTSMRINWSNGDGGNRIVVLRSGSAVTAVPTDTVAYSADAAFGTVAALISAGQYVVYNGSATSVTVTGLSPSTTYYAAFYDYNGSAKSINYLTTAPTTGSQLTPTPTITISAASLASFGEIAGGQTSAEKSYTVSGSNLTNDISITPQTGYEISTTSGSNFVTNPITLTQVGGTVNSTTIYVRFAPSVSASGTVSGNIVQSSTNATLKNVAVTGVSIGEPTTSATFVSSTSTPSTITLTWSGGNGTNKLVVVKSGIAVTGTPSDASSYTADAQYNNGQSTIAAGEYAVYNSTGTSVTVTGLSSGTEYYFKVFDYNGSSGAENYLATPALAAKKTTLASEPTSQAGSEPFDNIGPTSMRINWSNGDGSNRIVVLRSGSAVTAVPTDTVAYTANAAFGTVAALISAGQYVVYNGSGTSVTVTGLTSSTTYYAAFYDYNGSARSCNYLTTSPTAANQLSATPTITISAASLASFGEIAGGQTSAEKSYTVSGSNLMDNISITPPPGYEISTTSGSNFGANAITLTQAGGTVNSTTIYVRFAPSVSANGPVSGNITQSSLNATSKNVAVTGVSIGEPTTSATFVSSTSTPNSITLTWSGGNGENKIVAIRSGSSVSGSPVDASTYTADAQYNNGQSTISAGEYIVYKGNGTSVTVTGLSAGTVYYFKVFEYNGSGGGENYLTSPALAASKTTLASEPTTQPVSVTFDNVGPTSMRINWSNGDGNKRIAVIRSGSPVTAVPVDTVSYTANTTYGSGTAVSPGQYVVYNDNVGTSVTVTGLTHSTTYYVALFEYNGSAKSSNYLTTSPATGNQLSATPTITVSTASLASFGEIAGGQTSTEKSYTVSGSNLTNDISIAPPTGYEISTGTGGGFIATNPITLTQVGGSVNSTTIYVRFAPSFSASGTVSGNIVQSSTNATSRNVAVTGNVIPEPTQASNLSISSITHNSMKLTWTNGGGSSRIVLAKLTTAVNADPVDATTYTGNSSFGSGSQIGTGNYAVYIGSNDTITVTGLSPASQYYFSVYEFSGSSGSENYNITSPTASNATTLASPPSDQPTGISFSSVTSTQMTVSWTKGAGAANSLVLVRASSPVSGSPVDAQGYSPNTSFGSGATIGAGNYIVYSSSGTSVTVTNLSSAVTYYVSVFAYNGSSTTANYLTPAPLTGSQVTATPLITVTGGPLAFGSVQVGATSAVQSYTVAGSNLTDDIILHPPDQYEVSLSSGSGYRTSLQTLTVSQSGGTVNSTTIYVRYKPTSAGNANRSVTHTTTNGSGQTLDVTGTGIGEPALAASNVVFSNVTTSSMTIGWTIGDGTKRVVMIKSGNSADGEPVDGTTYTASTTFGSGTEVGTGNYTIYNNSSNSVTVSGLSPNTVYSVAVYEYKGTSGNENYLIVNPGTGSKTTLASQPTTQSSALAFTTIGPKNLTLSFTKGNGASRVVVMKAGNAVDSDPVDATTYSANTLFGSGTQIGSGNYVVYNGTGNSVSVSNLLINKTYHVAVYEYNGSGEAINYLTPSTVAENTTTTTPTITVSKTTLTDFGYVIVGANSSEQSYTVSGANLLSNITVTPPTGFQISTTSGSGFNTTAITLTPVSGTVGSTTIYARCSPLVGGAANSLITNAGDSVTTKTVAVNGTGVAEPTAQSTALTFSERTTTTMKVSWTKGAGTGARSLVVAHEASSVSAVPVDASTYTASTSFGSGAQVSADNYAVFNSAGNNVTVTGLKVGTTYYFAVYEFNGPADGVENYLTTSPLTGGSSTLTATPVTPASNIVFSNVTSSSMTIGWSNGDGTKRVVLVKSGNSVDGEPIDGITYTASTTFGSGTEIGTGNYTIYNSSSNSVTVNGLLPNTVYSVAVYEYKGTSGNENYLLDNPGTGSKTTLASLPGTQSSALVFTTVGPKTLTMNWTKGTGASRLVVMKAGNAVDTDPVDATSYSANTLFGSGTQIGSGNYVVYNGTGNSVSVSNLLINTTYHVAVYEYNGSGEAINYLTPSTVAENTTTATPTVTLSKTSLTNFGSVIVGTNSSEQSYTVSGANLLGNITVTPPTGFQISTTSGSGFDSAAITLIPAAGTVPATTIYARFSPSVSGSTSKTITHSSDSSVTKTVSVIGTGEGASIYITGSYMDFGKIVVNEVSAEQSYKVSASNVIGNVVITPPSGFQISRKQGGIFVPTNPITLTPSGNAVAQTDIYVRFAPGSAGNFLDSIVHSSTGTSNVSLSVTGTGIIKPTSGDSALQFSSVGPKTITLSWKKGNGINRIVVVKEKVTVDALPEDNTTYTANPIFGQSSEIGLKNYVVYNGTGTYVTVSGLQPNTMYYFSIYPYNGTPGSEKYLTDNVGDSSQSTSEPTIVITGALASFGNVHAGEISAVQNYSVSGTNLVNGISIVPPEGFQVSLASSGPFIGSNSSLALSPNNQVIDPTTIYVRCTPLTGGEKRDSISHVSTGSTTRYAPVSAYSIVEPTIPSSAIIFSSVKPTSMTITWKKGNGTKHLVFLGTDSISNPLPEDRMHYPSSFQYGEGASLTSNIFAVQSDSSNTVTVTHLTPNKKYYCAVFEYNGDSTSADYLTSSYASASQRTQLPVILVEGTLGLFDKIERNTTSGEKNYTVSGSALMNNIIITPPDGFQISLTSGLDFRSLNPITLINTDGIVSATAIYVRFAPTVVRVYSDSIMHSSAGATTIFSQVHGSCIASEPTKQASSIVVSSIGSATAAVVCTEGNGFNRLIIVSTDTLSDHPPVDGTNYTANPVFMAGSILGPNSSVVYGANGTSCVLTGLLPDTKHIVTVYEYNGEAGTENYLTVTKTQKEFITMVEAPVSLSPVDKAIDQSSTPTFVWKKSRNAEKYLLQVALNKEYTGTVISDTVITDTTFHMPITQALKYDTLYYWRVAGINSRGRGDFSSACSFSTASPPKLLVGTSRLNFGPKQIHNKYQISVVVRNNSITPLTLDSVHCATAGFSASISVPMLTRVDSSLVTISFSPDTIGMYVDTVIVYNNSVDRLLRIPVAGTAPAALFTSNNEFDFKEAQVRQLSEKVFYITNSSPNVLRIDSMMNRLHQFVVAVDSFPIVIARGDTFHLKLRCTPDSLKELVDTLYAYTNGNPGISKVVMKAHATNVSKEDEKTPEVFTLQQNFPNPFNPSTTIKFGLTQDAVVSLKMYDILGRQVGMLLNNDLLTPGSYRYVWDAGHLPSGVYFYQIIAATVSGNVKTNIFNEVRKLLLVK